jgi:pimeloyl-ACP methyl ester carboxylesterase
MTAGYDVLRARVRVRPARRNFGRAAIHPVATVASAPMSRSASSTVGGSPTLVLLPGLACDAALFRDQRPALEAAAGAASVAVSDVHTRHADLPSMAADLLAVHDGPLALVGSSMGGMLALEAWRQAPGRIAGLALLGTTARPDTPAQRSLRREAIGAFQAGRIDEVLRANVPFALHPDHAKGLVPDYLAMIRRAGAVQLIAQNRAVMARADARPLLPAIGVPVRVLVGRDDRLTPPDCGAEIAAAVPGATLETLPRCGHLLTWEQPTLVTRALLAWWGQVGLSRRPSAGS